MNARPFVLRAAPILIRLAIAVFALEAREKISAAEADQQSEQSLAQGSSLSDDIGNSQRGELIAWNRILGLSELGSEEELRSRLRAYYGFSEGSGEAAPLIGGSDGITQVLIESAGRTEYFQVNLDDESEETVIRLSGGVVIKVDEAERKRSHRVQADSVVFNEQRNSISAVGNISYVVDTDGRKERFSGDSLVFEVTDWTGVILRGTSERKEKVEEKTIDFFFRGESIQRSGPEILVLTDGRISSENVENPNYALKAEKIWITGPGEWGLFSATLYAGRIPILYLPFYWKAGRDLLFNPVIGHRDSVGYYIQTTIYLLGRKEKNDDFSMLGFGDSAAGDFTLEREGLYLVRVPVISGKSSGDASGETSGKTQKKSTLKFMLDAYSTLGGMSGFSGSFPDFAEDSSADFYASVGVSRSVNASGSPFFSKGRILQSYWNSGFIGDIKLPVRWGASTNIKIKSWSLKLNWYSDPYYLADFGSRKEDFDWLGFLLGEEGGDKDNKKSATGMNWELTGSHDFDVSNISPWLESAAVDRLNASLAWSTRANRDVTDSRDPDRRFNPSRVFFYPASLVFPDLQLSVRGAFPEWRINRSRKPAQKDEDKEDRKKLGTDSSDGEGAKDIILKNESREITRKSQDNSDKNGTNQKEETENVNKNKKITLKNQDNQKDEEGEGGKEPERGAPDYRKSFDSIYDARLLSGSLSYEVRSDIYVDDKTGNAKWKRPSDIDFTFEPAKIKIIQQGNIKYGLDFWDGLTGLGGSTRLSTYSQRHVEIFEGSGTADPAAERSRRLSDYKYSKFLWDNSFTVYTKPLQGVPALGASGLRYSFDGNLYTYRFKDGASALSPKYKGYWIDGAEDVKRHNAALLIDWKPKPFFASFKAEADIPPLDERYLYRIGGGVNYRGFKVDVSQQSVYKKSEWKPHPLTASASWTGWKNEVTVSQSARIDLENERLSNLESRIRFWGFGADFTASYGAVYNWESNRWIKKIDGDVLRPSRLIFSFQRTIKPKPLWKNRIRSETTLDTRWNINLVQPTDNVLRFKWTQSFSIYKFLKLKISFSAANRSMYLYFPWWREQFGIGGTQSFFEDLAKSFNLFNIEDRLDSQFNMDRVSVEAVHRLGSWDLSIKYSGWPALNTKAAAYEWKAEFSILIKWNPLPMFNQKTEFKNDKWTVKSFE